jgi:hypothetical protein
MFFGRMLSLVIAIAAIVGVFVEILIVSEWAFWLLVGAYLARLDFRPKLARGLLPF